MYCCPFLSFVGGVAFAKGKNEEWPLLRMGVGVWLSWAGGVAEFELDEVELVSLDDPLDPDEGRRQAKLLADELGVDVEVPKIGV